MRLQQLALDAITEAHIQALIEDGDTEGRDLDFKQSAPITDPKKDEQKYEVAVDISSLANAGGGHIVYGMDEKEAVASKVVPLEFDADEERQRIENIVRDRIEPRLSGIGIQPVDVSGGRVLIVRVPRSWNAPHAVVHKQTRRFFSRNSIGKYPLNVDEIRLAFVGGASLGERMRRFHRDRVNAIALGDAPIEVPPGPRVVVHLISFESFGLTRDLDLSAHRGSGLFKPLFSDSHDQERWNIDGPFVSVRTPATAYSQIFRNGIFEGVNTWILRSASEWSETNIGAMWLEDALNTRLHNPREVLRQVGVQPPIAVFVTASGVSRRLMHGLHGPHTEIDRDVLHLPDCVIESYDDDLPTVMRPAVDAWWQAGGFDRSPNYVDGRWTP